MHTSKHGLTFVLGYEGFRSCPYALGDGVWTVGYGSTHGVTQHTPCISKAAALNRAAKEIAAEYEVALNAAIRRYGLNLTQNEYDSFISFIYNLGVGMLSTAHDFGRFLSKRQVSKAIDSMIEYVDPGSKFEQGLRRRREAEQKLARTKTKPALTPEQQRVAKWQAELTRIRAVVHRLGRWTPQRQARAEALKQAIGRSSK